MATRNINLTDALDAFVAELVASGQFQNASEVVRAGLRLLRDEEQRRARKLELLRQAVQEGWDSFDRGEGIVVEDIDAYFDQIDAEIEAEIAAEDTAAARSPAE
jgi:antitoxin ParD1/3/4